MTEDQYQKVFVKKFGDTKSFKFHNKCNQLLSKIEILYAKMKPFNKIENRKLVSGQEVEKDISADSILLKDFLIRYTELNQRTKLKNKTLFQTAVKSFVEFEPAVVIHDITPTF